MAGWQPITGPSLRFSIRFAPTSRSTKPPRKPCWLRSPAPWSWKERETPRMTALMRKGDFLNPGDPVTPGIPAVFRPNGTSHEPENRLELAEMVGESRKPSCRARDDEPSLGAVLRTRHCRNQHGFRNHREPPLSSSTPRLARDGIYSARLEHEGDAEADRDFRRLSPVYPRQRSEVLHSRSVQSFVCSWAAVSLGRGSDPR